ncbi:hypothetical protein DFQ28_000919, partial [Apophysomyces sp. BC1034]
HLEAASDHLEATLGHLEAASDHLEATSDHLEAASDHLEIATKERLPVAADCQLLFHEAISPVFAEATEKQQLHTLAAIQNAKQQSEQTTDPIRDDKRAISRLGAAADKDEIDEPGPGLLDIDPISATPTIPTLPLASRPSSIVLRDYDNAVIHAFGEVDETPERKLQTAKFVDAMCLEPLAVLDSNGMEENLLGRMSVISSLVSKQKRGHALTLEPTPKRIKTEDSPKMCTMPVDLDLVVRNSHAIESLVKNKYVEMTDDIAELFNQDWLFRPQMRFFAAKALSGAVVVDPILCTAVMINTIEVYGRSNLVDAHHERCINKKGITAPSTNPPVDSRYRHIWVLTVTDSDGTKLNIGTKTFDALVTSSIRLDEKHKPELGPTTSKFIVGETHGRQIQIFLDASNYKLATKSAQNGNATNIQDLDILQQLRQVRSKFGEHSTYIPSRASSPLCNFHRTQPQTIFTYCTFDNGGSNTDGRLASRVFAQVASEVISKKEKAVLEKTALCNILKQCTPNGRVAKTITSMLAIYPRDCTSTEILKNTDLSDALKELAIMEDGCVLLDV